MEKSQYDLCIEVLRRLDKAGVLKNIVLVGSWCTLFYESYFAGVKYAPVLKTRDIDLLVVKPSAIKSKTNVAELLKDLGFVVDFAGSEGYIRFSHPQLIVEFLVEEKGRETNKPYLLPKLGANAQALRFLDLLAKNTISVKVEEFELTLPHPANYALHKLLVIHRRHKPEKIKKDENAAAQILRAVINKREQQVVLKLFQSLPKRWQKRITEALTTLDNKEILDVFNENISKNI